MLLKINTLLGLFLSLNLHAQPSVDPMLESLAYEMRANNLYHQLVWDFVPTNVYLFNQENGTITYTTENGNTVETEVEIMGSYFLGDKTFLWADKNKSVDAKWCTQVNGFRALLPEPCQKPKFKTTVDYLKMLSASFGGHIKANAADYVRQDQTILFFALKKIKIFENGKHIKTIPPGWHGLRETIPEKEQILQEFLSGYVQINLQYNKDKDDSKGFEALDSLKALFVEDPDDFLTLQAPFKHSVPFGQAIQSIRFPDLPRRVFILFSTQEKPWPDKHRAYEINPQGSGKKIFLQSFDVYGL